MRLSAARRSRSGPGMGSVTASPPSSVRRACVPSIPSARPRKTHQPSPMALVGPVPQAEGEPAERGTRTATTRGYRCRTTTRPSPRPYARSLRRRSADRQAARVGDARRRRRRAGASANAAARSGRRSMQPEQQVGRLAGLPRRRRAGAEVGIEAAELVEHRAPDEQPHLDDAPRRSTGRAACRRRAGSNFGPCSSTTVSAPAVTLGCRRDRIASSAPSGNHVVSLGKCRRRSPARAGRRRRRSARGTRRAPRSSRRCATPSLAEALGEALDLVEAVLRDDHDPVVGSAPAGRGTRSNRSSGSRTAERRDHETEIHNAPILYDGVAAPRTDRTPPYAHLHRHDRALDRHAVPQRGRDARRLHRQGAGLPRAQRRRRRGDHRRQRLDRRLAGHRARARRPRRRRAGEGLRQRAHGRHRGGARRVRHHGRRRRQLRLLRARRRSSSGCAPATSS